MIRFDFGTDRRLFLNPDVDSATRDWLEHYAPLECADIVCPNPHLQSERNGSRRDNALAVGLPRPNWPPPRPFRLNTVYWPVTGATRWAYAVFLVRTQDTIGPVDQGQNPIKLSSGQLVCHVGDPRDLRTFPMTALPARFLSRELALQPFVDARYFYQWKRADLNLTSSSTWADAFATVVTALGITGEMIAAAAAAYLVPDWVELTRRHDNAAVLLDALAWSIGCRTVFDPQNRDNPPPSSPKASLKVQDPNAAQSAARPFNQDPTFPAWMVKIGGGKATYEHLPTNIRVRYHEMTNGVPRCNGTPVIYSKATTPAAKQITTATTDQTVVSSLYASYPDNGFLAPDNAAKLQALADKIAEHYTAWRDPVYCAYDWTYQGTGLSWPVSGYDDTIELRLGHQNLRNDDPASFRIQSLPANLFVETNLSQDPDLTILDHFELGVTDAALNSTAGANVRIYRGTPGSEADTGIVVKAFLWPSPTANPIPAETRVWLFWHCDNSAWYAIPLGRPLGYLGAKATSFSITGTLTAVALTFGSDLSPFITNDGAGNFKVKAPGSYAAVVTADHIPAGTAADPGEPIPYVEVDTSGITDPGGVAAAFAALVTSINAAVDAANATVLSPVTSLVEIHTGATGATFQAKNESTGYWRAVTSGEGKPYTMACVMPPVQLAADDLVKIKVQTDAAIGTINGSNLYAALIYLGP